MDFKGKFSLDAWRTNQATVVAGGVACYVGGGGELGLFPNVAGFSTAGSRMIFMYHELSISVY